MLIGQFCETYPPSLDGVGRVMVAYCKTLSQMGHRGLYIAPENPLISHEAPACETLLYKSFPIPGQAYRFGFPLITPRFRRATRSLHFDVVHAHSPFLAGREARRLAKKTNAPVVATFHSKYYDDFYRATKSRLLAKIGVAYVLQFYRTCDEVWAVNQKTADVLHGYGFSGKIITMPNGTNLPTLTDEERAATFLRYPLREGIPTFIFAGQMDYKKNVDTILRAFALLQSQGLDFQVIMAGSGPNAKALKALARNLGLWDRLLFTGFLSEQSLLLSLFERSDLLVFPSPYDNAPMVVREAAAMGTPSLLIEDSCSAEGITHNQNGFLCLNTPESIAKGIADALPLCESVGKNARETIPLPWSQIMEQALDRYQGLIQKKALPKT